MNELSYPCLCGHIKGVHGYYGEAMHCGDCVCSFYINDYHEFKGDNLKYLEQKYEKTLH